MNDRRKTDPILQDIKKSVNRIDNTLHGNGKMGLKTRVFILWYGGAALFSLLTVAVGCAWKWG